MSDRQKTKPVTLKQRTGADRVFTEVYASILDSSYHLQNLTSKEGRFTPAGS